MSKERQFQQLMQREAEDVARLLQALEEENNAITARDAAAIDRAVLAKQDVIPKLESHAAERARLLNDAGFSADRDGMYAYLDSVDAGLMEPLKQQWEALREQLQACQDKNRINGQALEASRQVTQQVISLLLGQQPGTTTYGRDGSTKHSLGNHSYAKV